ncbi:hypothetical protein B0I35DRAFT_45087 [Stachybotrys elegans]|uniref:Zn(2)-C6 fungal-type domain-containing protein n=1 Tax=Stachybotrys elegans TaxID=80388 RepID=A0A8K0WXP3_9HYPO|nr:hypothetical protein B0I35DRAFT_45087 [Stachybotrys elegans]
MAEPPNMARTEERPAIQRRSCDRCRARKIACDRASPCSNCAIARASCVHSAIKPRTEEGRQRVLISTQYERKLDDIAKNIDGLKHLLQGLDLSTVPALSAFNSAHAPSSIAPRQLKTPVYEGGSSLSAHSAKLGQFMNQFVGHSSLRNIFPQVDGIMAALRNVTSPGGEALCAQEFMPEAEAPLHQLPPQAEAITVLRWANDHPESYLVLWLSQVLPVDKITETCQRIYFAVADYSQFDFIIVNACLSWLFLEYHVISGQEKYAAFGTACHTNVRMSLSKLPLLMPPTMDAITALTLGAFHAIDNAEALLAWTLTSAAANLSQTLGYHRTSSAEKDEETVRQRKHRFFWTVYRLDKALSLRLGRTPILQDHDVPAPADSTVRRWTMLAEIQGKTYNQLFSSSAAQYSTTSRTEIAKALLAETEALIQETTEALHVSKLVLSLTQLINISRLVKQSCPVKLVKSPY